MMSSCTIKRIISYKVALIIPILSVDAFMIREGYAANRISSCQETHTSLFMAGGGMGWGNNDFLSSLSGDDDDDDDNNNNR